MTTLFNKGQGRIERSRIGRKRRLGIARRGQDLIQSPMLSAAMTDLPLRKGDKFTYLTQIVQL